MRRYRPTCQKPERRRGIVAVLVAVSLVILVGALAFAVDGGYMFEKKHLLTAAAEASASAAAHAVFSNYNDWSGRDPHGTAAAIAQEYAASNGFRNNAPTTRVSVNIPPASGTYAGQAGYVEVVITHQFPRTFSSIFNQQPATITGRAVAAGTYVPTKASVLVLDPKGKNTVAIKGASLQLAGDLMINSTNRKALQVDKKGQIRADNIMVAGGIDRKQRNNLNLEGDLTTGVPRAPDPLSSLPVPSKGIQRTIDQFKTIVDGRNAYVLKPGYYPGKIEFRHDDRVILRPGTYYFNDEIKFRDQTTVSGNGVTLYLEGKKGIKFETGGSVSLSPPKTGTYAGITIFTDPASRNKVFFRKDADLAVSGSIYAPNGEVRFQQVIGDLGFADTDDDESEYDSEYEYEYDLDGTDPDPWSPDATTGSINAQLIARKLKLDKKSRVAILGSGINIDAPFLGIVE